MTGDDGGTDDDVGGPPADDPGGDDASDFRAEAETAGGGTRGDSPTEDGGTSKDDDSRAGTDDSRAGTDDSRAGTDDEAAGGERISDDEGGWTRLRRVRVALAGVAFAVGVALVAGGTWLSLPGLSAFAGPVGRTLVVVLGLVAVLQGLWAAFRARSASPDLADPPDPEPVGVDRPPVAGGEFDDAVERLADPGTPDGDAREAVRRDLRRTAVTLLAERTGCSRDEAAARVTRGDWTDDPRAAAFLGGPDAARVPLDVRVREWLGPGTPAGQRARRAAAEVVALAGEP